MKIITYSDLHLEFGANTVPAPQDSADLMVLAGDIITFKDFSPLAKFLRDWKKPVLYVAGNHEYYTLSNMRDNAAAFIRHHFRFLIGEHNRQIDRGVIDRLHRLPLRRLRAGLVIGGAVKIDNIHLTRQLQLLRAGDGECVDAAVAKRHQLGIINSDIGYFAALNEFEQSVALHAIEEIRRCQLLQACAHGLAVSDNKAVYDVGQARDIVHGAVITDFFEQIGDDLAEV